MAYTFSRRVGPKKLVPNSYELDLEISKSDEVNRFKDKAIIFKGEVYEEVPYIWIRGKVQCYSKVTYDYQITKCLHRKDPIPNLRKRKSTCYTGTISGRYARDVFSYSEIPIRSKLRTRYVIYIDAWGYYDTKIRATFRQPSRSWKRSKIRRQYLKNAPNGNRMLREKSQEELLRDYLVNYDLDLVLLNNELYNNAVVAERYGMKHRFLRPHSNYDASNDRYKRVKVEYYYIRLDGRIEYECPCCKYLYMTDKDEGVNKCDICDIPLYVEYNKEE